MLKVPIPEPGSAEHEVQRKKKSLTHPSSLIIGVSPFLYSVLAAGYIFYQMERSSFDGLVANNYIYGVTSVIVLVGAGLIGRWIHSVHRRIFGFAEILFALTIAYIFMQRIFFTSTAIVPYEAIFEFFAATYFLVQGARDAGRSRV